MANKLFVFNRNLPAPFDKAPKTAGVSSQYGDGTSAKLCATTVKAVLAYCKIMRGDALGALGQTGGKTVLEYKSAVGNEYHLVVYDPANGDFLAGIYDTNTQTMQQYIVGNKARDGAALMLALFPALMQDEEFRDNLKSFCKELEFGFPDLDAATSYTPVAEIPHSDFVGQYKLNTSKIHTESMPPGVPGKPEGLLGWVLACHRLRWHDREA